MVDGYRILLLGGEGEGEGAEVGLKMLEDYFGGVSLFVVVCRSGDRGELREKKMSD